MIDGQAQRHHHREWEHHGHARAQRIHAARDKAPANPAAGQRPGIGGEIGHPCQHAHFGHRETALLHQIFRQPEEIEPPNGIGEESRQQQAPCLRIFQQILPPDFRSGDGGGRAGENVRSLFIGDARMAVRRIVN